MQYIVGATLHYPRELNGGCVWNRTVSYLATYRGGEVDSSLSLLLFRATLKVRLNSSLSLLLERTTLSATKWMHIFKIHSLSMGRAHSQVEASITSPKLTRLGTHVHDKIMTNIQSHQLIAFDAHLITYGLFIHETCCLEFTVKFRGKSA